METSLRCFIEKHQSNFKMETKLSILHGVSKGLNLLHTRKPAKMPTEMGSCYIIVIRFR